MPMIDIVFLLIIFFVVTTNLDQDVVDESIKLAKSWHVKPREKYDPRLTTINVSAEEDGAIFINIGKRQMDLNAIENILRAVSLEYGTEAPVVIRASGNLEYRYVDMIVDRVGKAGLYEVSIASEVKQQ